MARLLRPLMMIVLAGISLVMVRRKRQPQNATPVSPSVDTTTLPPDALNHQDWRVRQAALRLSTPDDPAEKLKTLLDALEDPDDDVRNTAVALLTDEGKRAVMGLLRVLQQGSVNARTLAAAALGEIGSIDSLDELTAALSDESMWVRAQVTEALGKLGEAAISALTTALKDEDIDVRKAARTALKGIGTNEALAALKPQID
jgi:HEAT repeat protein